MPNQFTQNRLAHIDCANIACVYKLTHTPTGKFYVGSTKKLRTRISGHFHEMSTGHKKKSAVMCALYANGSHIDWVVDILEHCNPDSTELKAREQYYIDLLHPALNISPASTAPMRKGAKLDAEACALRAVNAKRVWERPEYREKITAARKGIATNSGYKCTPEQVANRRKAGRISNMKRNYGDGWQVEYIRRYPEYAGDLNA